MKIPIDFWLEYTIEWCILFELIGDSYIKIKICDAIDHLANKFLKHLFSSQNFEVVPTWGLLKHISIPVHLRLVVFNFDIIYKGKEKEERSWMLLD